VVRTTDFGEVFEWESFDREGLEKGMARLYGGAIGLVSLFITGMPVEWSTF
jgi:hypothetical protein